jgi:hypothetical protein
LPIQKKEGKPRLRNKKKWVAAPFSLGERLLHEYDFGNTTKAVITVADETRLPKQRNAMRLLARNAPPSYELRA